MNIDDICLICNGEIYNFKQLFEMINVKPSTDSDCEIIIHLYKKFGIEYTLSLLDGYFSFVIYDSRDKTKEPIVYIARDPYGVRPLYILKINEDEDKEYGNGLYNPKLKNIDELKFIFTSPTFLEEKLQKQSREFYIPHIYREADLCGGEFELRLKS